MKTNQEILEDFLVAKARSDKMSLATINNGDLIADFDMILAKVIANCADVNTPMTSREINIKITFKPSADRTCTQHVAKIGYKLAGMKPIEGSSGIAVDAAGSGPYAKRRDESEQLELFGQNVKKIKS